MAHIVMTQSYRMTIVSVCALLLSLVLITPSSAQNLSFPIVTSNASWSARHDTELALVPLITYTDASTGSTVTAQNAFVIFAGFQDGGGGGNDVWVSTTSGVTWSLISGTTINNVAAPGGGDRSYNKYLWSAQTSSYLSSSSVLYALGGCTVWTSENPTHFVWTSVNGGVTWNQLANGATRNFTDRCQASAAVTSIGHIYLVGGTNNPSPEPPLNDVWRSSDGGSNWDRLTFTASWQARRSTSLLTYYSQILSRDVLTVTGGRDDRNAGIEYNDVWCSTDGGYEWTRVTAAATWERRHAAVWTITEDGLMVVAGGVYAVVNPITVYNDVYVSLNGGLTWGLCVRDIPVMTDRWWPAGAFSRNGTLYLAAGISEGGTTYNDIYRSSISFNNASAVAGACSTLAVPSNLGRLGLQCWPPSPTACTPPLYTTAPTRAYTFDTPGTLNNAAGGTYGWLAQSGNSGLRRGIAVLNGSSSQYIDLHLQVDSKSRSFPYTIGASMTFETWINWQAFQQWARVIDIFNGPGDDEIFIANAFETNNLVFGIYDDQFTTGVGSSDYTFSNVLALNQWFHLVCSIQQITPGVFSSTGGLYQCFLNGRSLGTTTYPLPRYLARQYAYIGRPTWDGDAPLVAMIDSLYFYDYGFTLEQVTAHYAVPTPPIFELAFGVDPRPWLGISNNAGYGWRALDSTDINGTTVNNGVVTLNGNGQYIDMGLTSGIYSLGTELPLVIGGGNGTSFEILFRTDDANSRGTLFQIGAGTNVIKLEFFEANSPLTFTSGVSALNVVPTVDLGAWYHVVITVNKTTATDGVYIAYVNGEPRTTTVTGLFPAAVNRTPRYLGRSSDTAANYFIGAVDAFRIYDYVLSEATVTNLYGLVQVAPQYTTAPSFSYTFTSPVAGAGGTNYTWLPVSSDGLHTGIAAFNGVNQYINLLATSDDNRNLFPRTFGGFFSLETWIRFDGIQPWARILDAGAAYADGGGSNVSLGVSLLGNSSGLQLYNINYGDRADLWIDSPIFPLGVWRHIICSIAINPTSPNDPTASIYRCFVDGQQRGGTNRHKPAVVARPQVFIGASAWIGDPSMFDGQIDSWRYYDFGMSAEHAAVHFVVPRPPIFELTFDTDPRVITGYTGARAGYYWVNTEVGDYNGTAVNQGAAVFRGNRNEYINLATSTGPHSVGAVLPRIGGVGSEFGGVRGWTFEVLIRVYDQQVFGRIFDLAAAHSDDAIVLTLNNGLSEIEFTYYYQQTNFTSMTVIKNLVYQKWYHIVVIVQAGPQWTLATYTSYVNGVRTENKTGMLYPRNVPRASSFLGRSNFYTDQPFNGTIDAFRIYDYVLKPETVGALYSIVQVAEQYSTAPLVSYTFDTNRAQPPGTTFQWVNNGQQGHNGIARFNGLNNSINLLNFPDRNDQIFPVVLGGGSMSFEFWFRFATNTTTSGSRLIDISLPTSGVSSGISIGRVPSTNSLTFKYTENGVDLVNVVTIALDLNNVWTHTVCAILPNSRSTDPSSAAIYTCYINGVQRGAQIGPFPIRVQRNAAALGRYNTLPTPAVYFQGDIDAFYLYDYGLSAEEANVHFVVPRPPIFELSFATDPRIPLRLTAATAGYGWSATDPTAFNDAITNRGVVTFNGFGQYIALTETNGPNSVGTVIPTIGSAMAYSFEVEFATPDQQYYARFFDLARDHVQDGIHLNFIGTTLQLEFAVRNEFGGYTPFNVFDNVILSQWYHVVCVVERNSTNSTVARLTSYVNGVRTNQIINGLWPRTVARPSSFLGRSANFGTPDEYVNSSLSSFRIYDYALNGQQVANLYGLARIPELYSTAPKAAYTFDNPPLSLQLVDGTKFSWQNMSGTHQGIATFNGRDEWINLHSMTDRYGALFPYTIGGSMSLETWVNYKSFNQWSRLLEVSSGQSVNNIVFTNYASTNALALHVYDTAFTANTQLNIANSLRLNQWTHIICSISQRVATITLTNTAALFACYVNGMQVGSSYGILPSMQTRSFASIGQSTWIESDEYLNAEVDSFYFYNYGLSLEQAQVHYLLPRPPIFELSFAFDPRPFVGYTGSLRGYGWIEYDSTTFNNTKQVSGVVTLDGTSQQYIDLGTSTGPNSVGTTLPQIGSAQVYSIEILATAPDQQVWAKIIDWSSSGRESDNIVFGFAGDSLTMRLEIWRNNVQGGVLDVIDEAVLGQWYHVVLVIERWTANSNNASWTAYVNGEFVRTTRNVNFPRNVPRPYSFIGRSNWFGDQYYNGSVDAVRVYDYRLDPLTVRQLYNLTFSPQLIRPLPSSTSIPATPARSSATTAVASSSSGTDVTGGGGANGALIAIIVVIVVVVVAAGIAAYVYRDRIFGERGVSALSIFGGDNAQQLVETEMETAPKSRTWGNGGKHGRTDGYDDGNGNGEGSYRPPQRLQ